MCGGSRKDDRDLFYFVRKEMLKVLLAKKWVFLGIEIFWMKDSGEDCGVCER